MRRAGHGDTALRSADSRPVEEGGACDALLGNIGKISAADLWLKTVSFDESD